MKYGITILFLSLFLASFASAHEVSPQDTQIVVAEDSHLSLDIAFHLAVFGGLAVAGGIGLRENKKTTGKYLAWYRG